MKPMNARLIILDRDGVINSMLVEPDHGMIRSPLHVSQVKLNDGTIEALKMIQSLGYAFVIATNQPGASKQETTLENLRAVHEKILALLEGAGITILKSYICFHRAEDGCECRKPKPGLLNEALRDYPQFKPSHSWMVGDGVTDMQAGQAAGVKTAFLGPKKPDAYGIFDQLSIVPDYWGRDLQSFAQFLSG
jgi:D-glycero-D-manno-heptose 1,7-bisphosphate phosphatase